MIRNVCCVHKRFLRREVARVTLKLDMHVWIDLLETATVDLPGIP